MAGEIFIDAREVSAAGRLLFMLGELQQLSQLRYADRTHGFAILSHNRRNANSAEIQ